MQWIHRLIGSIRRNKEDGRLRCFHCRHDLNGLSVNALCPDCGEPVFASIIRRVPAVADDEPDPHQHLSRQPFEFVRQQTGYPVDAYLFIADVLLHQRQKIANERGEAFSKTRHVSAVELTDGLKEFAISYFGDRAESRDVLRSWNVLTSDDVGRIQQRMIDARLLAAGAHDPPEKFVGLFTLESVFGADGVGDIQ